MRSLGKKSFIAIGIAASIYAAPSYAATTINTTGGASAGNISPFGVPDTSTYGQTFTVGADNSLNSFSLYLTGAANLDIQYKAYIFAWTGLMATGPALYTSALQAFAGGAGNQELAFNTGNLLLTSGQQYVAFLSTSGLQAGRPFQTASMPIVSNATYTGGSYVFYNTGNDFSRLTTSTWDCNSVNCPYDAYFKASFLSGIAAVPEPGTWAMMLVGFGAIGFSMRRRRCVRVIPQAA